MPADFHFETDISLAATIPSGWYRDPAVLAREKDRIFGRTWQLVARLDDLARPGVGCAHAGDDPGRAVSALRTSWAARAAKTMASSSEFDARRHAPCRPVIETSPIA